MNEEGILYVATGTRYLEEAAENARAGRPHLGNRPITVMTDDLDTAEALECFDHCVPHPDPHRSFRDKIPALLELPFDRTLFLDTDARIVAPIGDLFTRLEHEDLLAAHAPVRIPSGWGDPTVPANFPELNSGVLVMRRNERQRELVKRWLARYDEIGQAWDQATLRAAAWSMLPEGLRLGILPPEANLRTTKPWIAGKGLQVTIIHGRVPAEEWAPLVEHVNGDIDRFRTHEQWSAQHPDTALTPRVAPSRRDRTATADGVAKAVAEVTARWPDRPDDPLSCEDPLFVLSAGWRSGSTLLQRMLLSDPGVMVWGEPHDRARIIQSLCDQWRPFSSTWPNEKHQSPLEETEALADAWPANRSPTVDALRQAHRLFFDRAFGEPARAAGRCRWGVKEVRFGAGELAYLRWLFPGARFLLLVRDPFDAYLSYRQRGPWFFDWPEAPPRGPAAFGAIWSRLATEFHAHSTDAACMLVRYEDLEEQAPAIAHHAGLQTIATPSSLSVQRGGATVQGPDRLGPIERARLAHATRTARSLLGY